MKVPYSEDIASHSGPEPHGGCGNTTADAWVGGSAGGALSSEITFFRVPTLLPGGEGNIDHSVICELWANPAESKHPGMRGYLMRGNREVRVEPLI